MQIVIDKESLIRLFTVAFYAVCGGDYRDVKNTVMELLDKVGYTPLPKGHGRLIDADRLESHDEYDGQGFTKSVYKDDIDNSPTIIEAESEGK